jgi:hypothetical protein
MAVIVEMLALAVIAVLTWMGVGDAVEGVSTSCTSGASSCSRSAGW